MSEAVFELIPYLEKRRVQVDTALREVLPAADADDPGKLKDAMRYGVLLGGKRMRPMVTIAACEALGGASTDALPPACAVEMIHAYSLVHDDLPAMDNDLERRGVPTVHVKYGEANGILVGDALLTHAFTVLADPKGLPGAQAAAAIARLAHHAGIYGMVGGQALDLEYGQDIRDIELLERVHALKTGGLYAASAAMGAIAGGADKTVADSFERWGLCFGIAFQHADDMLDDDQLALRSQALARVDALVRECDELAAPYGQRAAALRALSAWVKERAHSAAEGDKALD